MLTARLPRLLLLLISCLAFACLIGCAPNTEMAADPAATAGPMQANEFVMATIQFFCMALIVYFLLVINPTRTREDAQQKFISALKKNDEVLTSSGIFARVVGVKPEYITLEIAPNVKIKVLPKHVHPVGAQKVTGSSGDDDRGQPALESVSGKESGKRKK